MFMNYKNYFCAAFFTLLASCSPVKDKTFFKGVSVAIPGGATQEEILRLATEVRPSSQQLDYQSREMIGFIHVGMNTFTGREWGTGEEDPSIFNPINMDIDQWIKTFYDAGITAVIYVAKHHDGFCTWPSKYTEHTIAHSPYKDGKGDMVREVADACQKYGIKLCLYLSPWDMHEKTYGTEAYNDFYINQTKELLGNYGPVYLIWYDGAGTITREGVQKAPIDWDRYYAVADSLQPGILRSGKMDIRWIGSEAGKGRENEWCVQGVNGKYGIFAFQTDPKLGTIEDYVKKDHLMWCPSRGGLPIRKGWFYNAKDDYSIKSLSYMVDSYFSLVGQNSNVLLNLSPNKEGRIPERDAKRLIEFGNIIKQMKSVDYAKDAVVIPVSGWEKNLDGKMIVDGDPFTSWQTPDGVKQAVAEIRLKSPVEINVIKLQENVRDYGQRVIEFAVDAWLDGEWKEVGRRQAIGYRKMIRLEQPIVTDRFRIRFLDARVSISWGNFSLYRLPDIPAEVNDIPKDNKVMMVHCKVHTQGLNNDDLLKLIDDDIETVYRGKQGESNGELIFELPQTESIGAVSYLPVHSESEGHIELYELYTSGDGKEWTKTAEGRFDNIQNNPIEQMIYFQKRNVRYVKLVVKKSTSADGQFGVSEIAFYK